ncbi:class I SAM-dependent methyltransferase [Rhizobiaceae bacterium n13]|uniref:Class I SAM-dependent methyltransferase n=1 Tax=Ferirhizobium litorale TaxID=2927786 RepID=A0AAE3U278_9HYPH|nr:class I SAM-dependent methyltransferase [Fererhizobium litorale]MDI7860940.1 class I SAM-dependent methyltransferase [Fererhizobium litorale]MDI7921088.1 class I SAM-dependent methyltransferase [Fererhizobium litorale]
MAEFDRQTHWENIYSLKDEQQLSWYEAAPGISLDLIRRAGVGRAACVLDVGGGLSHLVDALVAAGQAHVTVLDLSPTALKKASARLSGPANVSWVAADVTEWVPDRIYDVWHDRAALHFLTAEEDQAAYTAVMDKALGSGGIAIIGTYAPDGPQKCSGLEVSHHNADSLQAILGEGYKLLSTQPHEHVTPWGATQKFQFSMFQKNSG